MAKPRSRTLLATILLGSAIVLAALPTLAQNAESESELFDPLYEVYEYVRSHFFKPEFIDDQEALYGAMKGIVEQLDDPYSEFLDPEDWERFDETLEGEFSGVGIEITLVDRVLTVITPLVGTPAEAAGVLAGDKILAIDEETTEGISLSEAAYKIRGETGTTVVLTILHEDGRREEIPIVRDRIVIDPVESELLADGSIGYIRILRFESDTTRMLDEALADFDLKRATVGATFEIDEDGVVIASVQPGTSAEELGLSVGDRLLSVSGTSVDGLDREEIDALLREERGTLVELEVEGSEGETRRLTVARDAGILGLILDLRNNAGGLMDQAISVASRFVDEGIVLRTESRLQGPRSFYTRSNAIPNLPLAILINRGTASASEIAAGAIRDNQMGILIGEKSFGKGVYQQLIEFDDGSALKITTGEYFTPNGTVVNEVGLPPDISTARRTEPIEVSQDLRQELIATLAEGQGREHPRPFPWHAPARFEITISIDATLGERPSEPGFRLLDGSSTLPIALGDRFVPAHPVPIPPERVISEEADPIEVATAWIQDHVGLLMPFDLASGEMP